MTATGEVNERQARQVAEQAREAQWHQPSFGKELFLGRLRLDLSIRTREVRPSRQSGARHSYPGFGSSARRRSTPQSSNVTPRSRTR